MSDAVAALNALKVIWKNTPLNWVASDPCGNSWDGIHCTNSRVTSITLASVGLTGQLSGDIQWLSELQTLDLSDNKGLTGSLPRSIGNLTKLSNLMLVSCGFSGPIPETIGSLQQLRVLSLSSNSFSGPIPPSIGNLFNLYWLDLTGNKLSGTIPVSNGNTPGLDKLVKAKHFHCGRNQLSGEIPPQLFNSNMSLIHVIFDNNTLSGKIPSTIGQVRTLEILFLSNNQLTGPLPDLTGLISLNYMDLSNNTFDKSDFPPWIKTLQSLETLQQKRCSQLLYNVLNFGVMENTELQGQIPVAFFSLPQLMRVVLRNNHLNGTLDIRSSYSNQLQHIDLQNNSIDFVRGMRFKSELILVGNPVCERKQGIEPYCSIQPSNSSYSTQPNNCVPVTCKSDQICSPNCRCALPFMGSLILAAPAFDLENSIIYMSLENYLMSSFHSHQLPVDSVSLSKISYNPPVLRLKMFPHGVDCFNRTGISEIGFVLHNLTSYPGKTFGPLVFIADQYVYFAGSTDTNKSLSRVIIGAAVGCSLLVILSLLAGIYAFHQKRRAEISDKQNNPFASWDSNKSNGGVPQLKGARCFSFEELKKYTNTFSEANCIGSGGYGKVYRGTLPTGQLVAIKRAKQGSMQGGLEFKSELELLSRVHHKNVVSLVGYCFEQGEQVLVYEYIANGTLKESLSGTCFLIFSTNKDTDGKSGIRLDWMRRLRIALGAASGLQYLHELANPPIIHRDIKSNNILLDEYLNAKVSDFGLSKSLLYSENYHISTQVKGTMGYLDPEYCMTQQLTEKSDVYAFGVLMIELITAKQPIEKGKYIVLEARQKMDKAKDLYDLHEILDPNILGTALKGLEKFLDLAMRCVEEEGAARPTMGEVVKEIENIMQIAGWNPTADSVSTSVGFEGTSNHPCSEASLSIYIRALAR
ncbi:probable leucine-rich repeat receptor-like protein kinase At5g49770 isoform X5 [Camellia sinensis]|uniref:probable leucine-rich repeat receptor-like protein kinase At5g49770 isoform X5 n=1 Tax=Camellia sinensis TaxID=4442 RepID=UPI001036156A|nr:probable leucine-rich repeat receptor-like protein kinase At5g49770 isoform X5 [Camellia sinensis]XP_028070504.1 probable leucine-rich repeat receptor-like protein kinase At5g49770 isoform X5 [Camellia sinensis]XP_028070505.1 probable leucine-rich repeat receptor-like protein kinase At5g49770 isoform X5 [Camellia sinensis]